ncbi:hypothetical protein FQ142_10180 [Microbacterium sp. ANT_H45B]|uniref:hypothetical protein n=1 Tax=Microbacterium sp. ANT_H45B TaxID=2597346 RepID=UPI0011EE30C1|nr:hypothetical protein [Microbacterium sp. ANT_H45B]KAA0961201.1 hypothetical protein FQ142_10180 [Microbacterium sp. ANT_H45B]
MAGRAVDPVDYHAVLAAAGAELRADAAGGVGVEAAACAADEADELLLELVKVWPGADLVDDVGEPGKWLDAVRGSDSIRAVARKIGTTHATLNRQANDDSLSFELVRSIS